MFIIIKLQILRGPRRFSQRSREPCIVGQVDNLRTDCQSVPPGNARPRPRPSRVWLRPQAALGSSVAQFFLRTFSSASLACPRARAERDMKGTAPWILEFASMPGVRVAPRRRKPERAKERSPRREPCGNRTLLLAAPERGGRAPAGTSYAPFRGYPLRRHSRRLTPRATFLCSSGVPLAPNAARE